MKSPEKVPAARSGWRGRLSLPPAGEGNAGGSCWSSRRLPDQGRPDPSQSGTPSQKARAGTRAPATCFTLKLEETDSLAIT